jgi:hypothetical protein
MGFKALGEASSYKSEFLLFKVYRFAGKRSKFSCIIAFVKDSFLANGNYFSSRPLGDLE